MDAGTSIGADYAYLVSSEQKKEIWRQWINASVALDLLYNRQTESNTDALLETFEKMPLQEIEKIAADSPFLYENPGPYYDSTFEAAPDQAIEHMPTGGLEYDSILDLGSTRDQVLENDEFSIYSQDQSVKFDSSELSLFDSASDDARSRDVELQVDHRNESPEDFSLPNPLPNLEWIRVDATQSNSSKDISSPKNLVTADAYQFSDSGSEASTPFSEDQENVHMEAIDAEFDLGEKEIVSESVKKGRRPARKANKKNNNRSKIHCPEPLCVWSFDRSSDLKRHVRSIHTKEKLFICSWKDCPKSFVRKDALSTHMKWHVSSSPKPTKYVRKFKKSRKTIRESEELEE